MKRYKIIIALCVVSFALSALASKHEFDSCTNKSSCSGACVYSERAGDPNINGNCVDTPGYGCTCT